MDADVIGGDLFVAREVTVIRWSPLPGLEAQLPKVIAPIKLVGSLATTPFGRGDATAVSLGGTRWLMHSLPLEDISLSSIGDASLTADGKCHIGAAYGERLTYEFAEQVNIRPIDRTNDRTTEDPSVRTFVHYVHPLPGSAAPVDFPRAHPDDHAKLCEFKHVLRREHLPKGGCPGAPWTNISEPFPGGPWCAPWDAPVFIAELRCAFVETAFAHVSQRICATCGAWLQINSRSLQPASLASPCAAHPHVVFFLCPSAGAHGLLCRFRKRRVHVAPCAAVRPALGYTSSRV